MQSTIRTTAYIIPILLFNCFVANAQQHIRISGHIIDDSLNDLTGARITNLNTHQESYADTKGHYTIEAAIGDSLRFTFVGQTAEKRIVTNTAQHINVLLINRWVNDLGAIWSKKQWRRAEQQVNRHYDKLVEQAKKTGKWDN